MHITQSKVANQFEAGEGLEAIRNKLKSTELATPINPISDLFMQAYQWKWKVQWTSSGGSGKRNWRLLFVQLTFPYMNHPSSWQDGDEWLEKYSLDHLTFNVWPSQLRVLGASVIIDFNLF